MLNRKSDMTVDDVIGCKQFYDFLQTSLRKEGAGGDEGRDKLSAVKFELDKLACQRGKSCAAFRNRCEEAAAKYFSRFSEKEKTLAQQAMDVTKAVMTAQDEERKRFMVGPLMQGMLPLVSSEYSSHTVIFFVRLTCAGV